MLNVAFLIFCIALAVLALSGACIAVAFLLETIHSIDKDKDKE